METGGNKTYWTTANILETEHIHQINRNIDITTNR